MRGRTWTTSEVAKLRAMRLAGCSAQEIGDALDRTKYAVQSYLYYMVAYHGRERLPLVTAEQRRQMEAA